MSDPAVPPNEENDDEVGNSALRSFLGLFVVPLLVVVLCVAVFIGFGWIAYDRQTTSDYLNDLQSWWKPRRVQAAYELSKILVADPKALEEEPGAKQEVRRLFREAEEPEMRQYLALVLGRTTTGRPCRCSSRRSRTPTTRPASTPSGPWARWATRRRAERWRPR